MPISKTINGTTWEFFGSGRIDGAAANELEIEVLAAIRGGAREILINLAEATWICSAGIRVILQFHRQLKTSGGSLLVTRPSPEVDEILEMTGFRKTIVEGASSKP